jgi:hypothetical protein
MILEADRSPLAQVAELLGLVEFECLEGCQPSQRIQVT